MGANDAVDEVEMDSVGADGMPKEEIAVAAAVETSAHDERPASSFPKRTSGRPHRRSRRSVTFRASTCDGMRTGSTSRATACPIIR
jgi:hypothetical protein